MNDGRIVGVMEVVGVGGSRVLFERYRPPHDTVLKRYRAATLALVQRAAELHHRPRLLDYTAAPYSLRAPRSEAVCDQHL